MNSDVINRQDAIDELQKEINKGIPPFDNVIGSIRCGVRLARNIIEDLPSAEKIGKWKKVTKHHKDDKQEFDYYEITCSVCGSRPERPWHLTAYCPNCGAKMKNGGENDE